MIAPTHIVLALAQAESGSLISRSKAKRVLAGLEAFREVQLDFRDVSRIGPAFADEIFRVWARAHPESRIVHSHANEAVARMIARSAPPMGQTGPRDE